MVDRFALHHGLLNRPSPDPNSRGEDRDGYRRPGGDHRRRLGDYRSFEVLVSTVTVGITRLAVAADDVPLWTA